VAPVQRPVAPVQQPVAPVQQQPVVEPVLNIGATPFVPSSPEITSVHEIPSVPSVPSVMYVVQPVPIFLNIPMYNPAMYYAQQDFSSAQQAFDPQMYMDGQSVPQNSLAFGQTLPADFASPSFLTFPCVYY
jgi:hypothetical protein